MKFLLIFLFNVVYLFGGDLHNVELAKDIYSSENNFIEKYKTLYDSVGYYSLHGITFAILNKNNSITIVFRGTVNKKDLITDVAIKHIKFQDINGTKVHYGFYKTALEVKKILKPILDTRTKYNLVGHSLGGALALMLGSLLEYDGYKVKVVTFGSPPVGNGKFVSYFKELEHYRYVHRFDIIPKLNKKNIGKFKKFLDYLSSKTEHFSIFKGAVWIIKNLPYEFVHQGKEIILKNKAVFPSHLTKKQLFLRKTILRPLAYHSIATYENGIKLQ